MYCRIFLQDTKYKEIEYKVLDSGYYQQLEQIYKDYYQYKKFSGMIPLFIEELKNPSADIIGYYDNDQLVAFSMIYCYPSKKSCLAEQFAWNYKNPSLKLGYKSIRSECARYKRLGFDYMYLGDIAKYKQELQGFEII